MEISLLETKNQRMDDEVKRLRKLVCDNVLSKMRGQVVLRF